MAQKLILMNMAFQPAMSIRNLPIILSGKKIFALKQKKVLGCSEENNCVYLARGAGITYSPRSGRRRLLAMQYVN
jgi:hypothetical protein